MKLVNKSCYSLELTGDELRMLTELIGNHSIQSHEDMGVTKATAKWSFDVLYSLLRADNE